MQEALTNALKHAPGAHLDLLVRYEESSVVVEVVDDGPGDRDGSSRGHGLIGMRERVELFGGTLEAGPGARAGSQSAPRCRGPGAGVTGILVADDERLVRGGYRMIFSGAPDLEVVGEAADGLEAVDLARRLRPDVVLMDVRMPRLDGIAATRRIAAFDTPPAVIVVTTFDLDEYVFEALRAGACGFLLKDAREEQLLAAVRGAAEGVALFMPSVTRRLVERFARPDLEASPVELTGREREIWTLVAKGLSNADIAGTLVISETTVKTHVSRLLMKLGATSRTQAVVMAYETGQVRPGDNTTSR